MPLINLVWDHVTQDVFRQLVNSPTLRFFSFLFSSSTLHRFRDHPAIKQKITRAGRSLRRFITLFSIIIADFCLKRLLISWRRSRSKKVLISTALSLVPPILWAWTSLCKLLGQRMPSMAKQDFDINRDNILHRRDFFALDEFRPSKITAFERELEQFHTTNWEIER